jgi:hypothetical protein
MRGLLGLSIGATQLVAARADGTSILRRAELPWRGTVLTGFVERVGDPVPIVAPDGSAHSADRLLAAAVTDLVSVAGRPGERFGVAVPAHWSAHVVDRVRGLLPGVPVTSDATAALVALRAHPGLPARGVVVLCDFGATGTSVTLADSARNFAPIGPTLRYEEFSGDLIDRAVLAHLLAEANLDPEHTSAVASLRSLRDQCRGAKERLSRETATGLAGPVPGATVRLTRRELDALMREPIDGLLAAVDDQLRRAGVRPAELAALATVGGGARIPIVTQRLSEALRCPVTTTPDAQTVAATGAAILAGWEPQTATRFVVAPGGTATLAAPSVAAVPPRAEPALAWSQAPDERDIVDFTEFEDVEWARPPVAFQHVDHVDDAVAPLAWYRRPAVLFAAAACAALTAAAGLVVTMDGDAVNTASASPISSVTSVGPAAPASPEVLAAPTATQPVQEVPGPTVVSYSQVPAPQPVAPQPQAPVAAPPPQAPPPDAPTTTTPTTTTPTTTTTTATPTPTTSAPTSTTTPTTTSAPTSTTTASTPRSTSTPPSEPPPSPPSSPPSVLPTLSLPSLTSTQAPSSAHM